jgi:AAA+ superfamily predicted ATPase
MREAPIQISGPRGEPFGRLRIGALALVAESEQIARSQNLPKGTALPMMLRHHLEEAGYRVRDSDLAAAVATLEGIRRGVTIAGVHVRVSRIDVGGTAESGAADVHTVEPSKRRSSIVSNTGPTEVISFFEMEHTFPNEHAQMWYERLVGLDDQKERLLLELEMLLFPDRMEEWSRRHHRGNVLRLIELQRNRVPLILFEGDVGTGKTALSETAGDALARRIGKKSRVHLLKVNTQVRGTGQVGEMSDLIVQAFTQAEARARALKDVPVLLLLDEADALAASRDNHQMHHEDKAGLNTLLQRLDNLRLTRLPMVAIFITNRPEALDPAIRRRAALCLYFDRPDDEVRAEIIRTSVPELHMNEEEVHELVNLTGEQVLKNKGVRFTSSDLTDRLLPGALRTAFAEHRALGIADLVSEARRLVPTPRLGSL